MDDNVNNIIKSSWNIIFLIFYFSFFSDRDWCEAPYNVTIMYLWYEMGQNQLKFIDLFSDVAQTFCFLNRGTTNTNYILVGNERLKAIYNCIN